MQMIPLKKQSKRQRREYYAAQRGSWNGLNPVTRTAESKKTYRRSRERMNTIKAVRTME